MQPPSAPFIERIQERVAVAKEREDEGREQMRQEKVESARWIK